MKNPASTRAFTLIELLVVIAIISIMAVLIGFGLKGDRQTVLRSGQATMATMISATRAQAALNNTYARLLINANKDNPDRFLRYMAIQYKDTASGNWITVNEGVTLPNGIAVLPDSDYPSSPSQSQLYDGSSWNNLRSSMFGYATSIAVNSATNEAWIGLCFTSRGTGVSTTSTTGMTGGQNNGDIILGTTINQDSSGGGYPVKFDNPNSVRGLTVSTYGIVTYVNEKSGYIYQ